MSATPETKRTTGLKYGATGQLLVMQDEDLELYETHKKSFHDEYQPQGATEENLVQALADVCWRLNRVALLESNLLSISYSFRDLVAGLLDQSKALASLSMHSQRLSRQFERTVALLRDLQKTRRAQQPQESKHQITRAQPQTATPPVDLPRDRFQITRRREPTPM